MHSPPSKRGSSSASELEKANYSDNEYSCKIADERRLVIIYEQKGSPLPCRVLYSKDPSSGKYIEIRRAKHEENNCEMKARQVAKKFEDAGWRCDHSIRSTETSDVLLGRDSGNTEIATPTTPSELQPKASLDPVIKISSTLPSRNIYSYSLELDGRLNTNSKEVSYNDVTDKTRQSDLQLDLVFLRRFRRIAVGPTISLVRSNGKNSLTKSAYSSDVWGFGLAAHYDFDSFEKTFCAPFLGLFASKDLAKASDKLFDLDVRSADSTIKIAGQLGVKNPLSARLDLKAFLNLEKIIYGRTEKQASVGSTNGAKINLGFGLAQYL